MQHFPTPIKTEEKVIDIMLATVLAFPLETGKISIAEDHLLPHMLVSRVCSTALFGLCSMKSRHMFLLLFLADYLHCFIFPWAVLPFPACASVLL